jgi:hypothetical protein
MAGAGGISARATRMFGVESGLPPGGGRGMRDVIGACVYLGCFGSARDILSMTKMGDV